MFFERNLFRNSPISSSQVIVTFNLPSNINSAGVCECKLYCFLGKDNQIFGCFTKPRFSHRFTVRSLKKQNEPFAFFK